VKEDALSPAVRILAPVADSKAVIPVMSHLVMEVNGDSCSIVGGNMFRFGKLRVPLVSSSGSFSMTVDADRLQRLLQNPWSSPVGLEFDQSIQEVRFKRNCVIPFASFDPGEYPDIAPIEKAERQSEIGRQHLIRILEFLLPYLSSDSQDEYGLNNSVLRDGMILATNAASGCTIQVDLDGTFEIGRDSVGSAIKFLKFVSDEKVVLSDSESFFYISTPDLSQYWMYRKCEMQPPEFRLASVEDDEIQARFKVDRMRLSHILGEMLVVATEMDYFGARMKVTKEGSGDTLTLSVRTEQGRRGEGSMACTMEKGDSASFSVQAVLLKSVLSTLSQDEIEIELGDGFIRMSDAIDNYQVRSFIALLRD